MASDKFSEFNTVFDRYLAPPLKAAGFKRRSDWSMVLRSSDDDLWVIVQMRPITPIPIRMLHLEWGVSPDSLRRYHRELWPKCATPVMTSTIFEEGMTAPADLQEGGGTYGVWAWDPNGKYRPKVTLDQFGEKLNAAIHDDDWISRWSSHLSRDVVLDRGTHKYSIFEGRYFEDAARLILYIDHAEPGKCQQWLDELGQSTYPYPRLLASLQLRLDSRTATIESG